MSDSNYCSLTFTSLGLAIITSFLLVFSSSEYSLQSAFALPEFFTNSNFVSNLNTPTAMEFAPDGRLFITEKGGTVRVVKNDILLATPFLSVTVNSNGERGLNGITFDPNFSVNGYVYVYYTVGDSPFHNRVSRFTANPQNPDISLMGSETQIINLDTLSSSTNHNGGAIHFDSDGKLYVATGDAGKSSNSQSLSSQFGKILRINPNGSIPTDNPFFNTVGAKKEIWALGLRNPFTMAFSNDANKLYINDVGSNSWEEVNLGIPGANYGWPSCEGPCSPTNPIFTDPVYSYSRGSGAAITGGVFYESTQFPIEYQGNYFFGDYVNGFIKRLDSNNNVFNFEQAANSPVDIDIGPDGKLYYLSIGAGEVRKIEFAPANQSPTAILTATPTSVQPLQEVMFSGALSTDPNPGTILSYSWNFGDGSSSGSGITIPHIYTNFGKYTATLTVDDGEGGVDSASIKIEVGNPPVGTILTPENQTRYNAGDTISFEGSGTDTQNNSVLPENAFKWIILFHHNTHTHPFLEFNGIKQGNFIIPDSGESSSNVWYRIYLTTTNSIGLSRTVSTDVIPNTSTITLNSNIPGLQVKLDGQPQVTPKSFVGVVGFIRELKAVNWQELGGVTYQFNSWSNNGNLTHLITTPSSNVTYTVNSSPVVLCSLPQTSQWIIVSDCTIMSNFVVLGDVQIQNGSRLTIENGGLLDIDFTKSKLVIKSGSSMVIKSGGKLN